MTGPLPDRIGRYRVESVLGRGAMGVIFRAHDPVIDRPIAIKLVRADLLDGEDRSEYVARFQREAQAAGRCAHPNIVAIYDYALHDGNPYLAMEYIDGVTLQQEKDRPGGFTSAEIVAIGTEILDGLAAAHTLGIVHRDIKPANVMLTASSRVKLTDFGISRLDASHLTGAGTVVGTPSYMSPEQCRGETADARSDLFSVAVVLFELLTGAKPFRGASQHEVWHNLLYQAPPDSQALRPDAPLTLHAAIRRGLAKDPADRFQNAAAMAAALRGGPAALDADRTVVRLAPSLPEPELGLDSTAITTIERGLARHVGPIAGYLVRSAVRKADSVAALCDVLVSKIEDATGRDDFRREMESQISASLTRTGRGTGAAAVAPLPDVALADAQAELARFVGPIARILVKRAAPGCTDVAQLWQRLAENVEEVDREAFLRRIAAPPDR